MEKRTEAVNDASTLPDICVVVELNAPIDRAWSAVATSEGLAAWFMPNDFEPRVGHTFHLNAGQYGMSPCKVTEVTPPNRLSFEWDEDWTLTFELEEVNDKTRVTIIHSGWKADELTKFGEPLTVVRERMSKGWTGLGTALRRYIEGS